MNKKVYIKRLCRNKITLFECVIKRLHYLIQVSLIWRVHVLQEMQEIREMDLL